MVAFIGALQSALGNIVGALIGAVPNLVAAIVILIIGFIVGKVVAAALTEILTRAKVDNYVKVKKAEFRISHIFTELIKWVIYLLFLQQAADTMGIEVVSVFLGQIVNFLPRAIEATLVVVVGYALARYVEGLVADSDFVYSHLMSRVFFFLLVYISIALALPLVGLSDRLINAILLIIVGSLGLGFAIALGYGLRGLVEDFARDYAKRARK